MNASLKYFYRTLRLPFNRRRAFARLLEFHGRTRTIEEVVDWAMRFPSHGLMRVDSIQRRSEILALAKTVAALKPRRILEIGTARGGTLFIWAQLAAEKVVSCDLEDPGPKCGFYQAFPPPGSRCRVVHLAGNSHEADFKRRVEKELDGGPVDFLFIDGDHTEKGVTADYDDYRALVRPGGVIAFHDIAERQALPTNQVQHFWRKLKARRATEEFIDDPNQTGYGIGIVRVPD
jgi:predicted O-methyltransferase YrrM